MSDSSPLPHLLAMGDALTGNGVSDEFSLKGLQCIGAGGGFAMWHYRSRSPLWAVQRRGYFPRSSQLKPGDRLSVNFWRDDRFMAAQDFVVTEPDPVEIKPCGPMVGGER